MSETLLQFRGSPADGAVGQQPTAQTCPVCHQNFSSDARFCPFDGEPLVAAQNYDPSGDPLIGSVVDQRYAVEGVLGEGGMGTVYRVRHASLGKGFALKALRSDLALDAEIAERFIGEARTAAAISHPGLVEIIDFGSLADGRPYFVMELLEGGPLSWFIREGGPIPPARALGILRQAAEAVAAAHRAGIVHRDLKPDNVHMMMNRDGTDRVKVLDFGLAKVMGGGRRTRQGVVFGTPHYMSPEQAAGENVDHRADIYSLGIVMYEMLTGRVPFEADSFMGVLSKHIYMSPTPPSQLVRGNGDIGVLEGIVLCCLEKKPSKRFQSCDELTAAIDRVIAGVAVRAAASPSSAALPARITSAPADSHEPGARLPVKPVWPFVLAAGLLALTALGFVAVRMLRSSAALEPGTAPPARSAPAPLAKSAPAAALEKAPVVPAVTPGAASSLPPRPTAGALPSPRPVASEERNVAAEAKPVPPETASSAPGKVAPAAARPRRPSGVRGEIIDPWGQ